MTDTLRSEWGKAWSVPSPAGCLVAAVLATLLTATSLAGDFAHGVTTGERPADATLSLVTAVGPSLQVGQLLVAAFALLLVTAEHHSGALASTLLAQPRRVVLLAATTTVAAACAAALGVLLGPAAAWTAAAVVGDRATGDGPGHVLALAPASATVLAAVAVLAVAAGTIARSSVGALGAVLVVLLGSLAVPPGLGEWLPGQAAAALLEGAASGVDVVALAVLVGWSALAWGVAARCFVRRDA